MAHTTFADRVKETTTTTGTGTINLGGAVSGYQTFVGGVGNGHYTYYSIFSQSANEWEVGLGLITSGAPDTLSRDTIISSSNSGLAVNFSAGTKDVICTMPASKSVIIDGDSNISVTANLSATLFSGSGASLTSLNATNVASGTLPNARLDQQLQDVAGLTPTSGKFIQGDGANFIVSAYSVPTADGSSGQVLTTNGSGAVTFQTPTVGDITAVTAGDGLTGGGTTGDVTLNVGAGTGVTVAADTVSIGQDVATSASPTFAGGTFTANVALGDSNYINLGASQDLQIVHNHLTGVSSVTDTNVGGTLNLQGDNITLTGPVTATGDLTVDTDTLYVDSTNNRVGIGTTSPSSLLHIAQTSDDTGGGLQIRNTADTNSVFIYQNGTTTTFDSGSSGDQAFRVGNAERMRIDSSGNVGIGTTSPSEKLEVVGNIRIVDSAGDLQFYNTAETIKTAEITTSGANFVIQSDPGNVVASSAITFETDGTERASIDSSGLTITGAATLQDNTGQYGSIEITGGATGGYNGYSIGGNAVFMENGSQAGLYDDINNDWIVLGRYLGNTSIYYAGAERIRTTTDGAQIVSGSLGVNTTAPTTNGQVRATNNIIAYYSDERLKNFEGKIDNALDKVTAISGYYYTENEVAKSLGYDNDERQVGVSAQEVLEVMPEVVTDAPINFSPNAPKGSDYKTVQYEKLVPLLIEAIKELEQEVKEIKEKVIN